MGIKYQVWQYCEGIGDKREQKFIYSHNVVGDSSRAKALAGVFVCDAKRFVLEECLEKWLGVADQNVLTDKTGGEFVSFRER